MEYIAKKATQICKIKKENESEQAWVDYSGNIGAPGCLGKGIPTGSFLW